MKVSKSDMLRFCLLALLAGCATSEQRAFERGILPGVVIKGQPLRPGRLTERLRSDDVAGLSVAVVRHGRIEWTAAYGTADRATGRPLTPRSRMLAGSISKPVTAFAALRLVARGLLSLDEDVNARLHSWKVPTNEFTRDHPVTLAQLLNHTSGIRTHHYNLYADEERVPTLKQILDGEAPSADGLIAFDAIPGTRWEYSNTNYLIVEQLIEDVTGRGFAEALDELVLRPLGMNESTFVQPRVRDWRGDRAAGHDEQGQRLPGPGYFAYPQLAVAGLWTTAGDLARFVIGVQRAMAGRSALLSAHLARRMAERGDGDWGLGLHHASYPDGRAWFDHSGSDAGYGANLSGSIHGDDGVAIMMNTEKGRGLSREAQFAIRRVYHWPGAGPVEKTVARLDESRLRSVAGRYRFADGQVASITFDAGHLWWSLRDDRFELFPEAPDRFFALAPGEPTYFFKQDPHDGANRIEVTLIGMKFDGERVP